VASQITKVLTALAVVAALAFVGPQPARAQVSYRSGYDPVSGWSWDRDFRYNSATNPFGYRGSDWSSPSYSYGVRRYNNSYGATAQSSPAPDNAARVRVVVPAGAKVWFDGKDTKQTGTLRRFESPQLTPGKDYTYDVKATWTENGKEVTRTRHVDVRANSGVTVDFTRPESGT